MSTRIISFLKKWSFIGLLSGLVVFRLTIWKLMHTMPTFYKEDLGNAGVALAIMFLALGWLGYKWYRRQSIRMTGLEWPFFIFAGAAVLSLTYTADVSSTFEAVLVLISHVALFYMIQDTLDTQEKRMGFLYVLLGCAFLTAAFGVKEFFYLLGRAPLSPDSTLQHMNRSLHYVLSSRRITSFLGWPNSLAGYLALILPLSLFLPFHIKKGFSRWVSVGVAIILVVAFLFTFSFLGWLSFILSTIVILIMGWKAFGVSGWSQKRKIFGLSVVSGFAVMFLWIILRKNFAGSLLPRLEYYKSAWGLFLESPLVGHGFNTFGIVSQRFAESREGLTAFVHNSYVQMWLEAGLLGFAGLLWVVGCFFTKLWRRFKSRDLFGENWLVLVLGWGLLAFFIDNLFSFTFLKSNIAVHGWVMLGVFYSLGDRTIQKSFVPVRWALGISLAISCVVAFLLAQVVLSFGAYYKGYHAHKQGNLIQAQQGYIKAASIDGYKSAFAAAAGEVAYRSFYVQRNAQVLREAEKWYLEAIRRSPQVYGYNFILSRIYLGLKNVPQANFYARRAKFISPVQYGSDIRGLRQRVEKMRQMKLEEQEDAK